MANAAHSGVETLFDVRNRNVLETASDQNNIVGGIGG